MKCVKCGNELQPGARFCVYCGTPAATEPEPVVETPVEPEPAAEAAAAPEAEAAVPQEPVIPEVTPVEETVPEVPEVPVQQPTYQQPVQQQPVQQPTYQQPVQQQPVYQQQYQQPVQQPVYQQPVQQPAQKKSKKGLVAVIIVVIVLIAALVAAAVALIFVFKNKTSTSSNRQLSYVKNEKLYYVKDVSKDSEPIVVSSVKNAEEYIGSGLSGTFTADGSYLYFYSKFESTKSGKLCRVEVSKLKNDEDKNEDLIEDLVSGVSSYTLLDNDRFIYENDSDELYYYDGEDKNKITSGVSNYYLGEDDSVYFTISDTSDEWSDSYQLNRYSIADDETTKLIDNCTYIVEETEDGWFYAAYDTSDYLYDLYYASKDGDSQLVASDTYNIVGATAADSTVYYVTERKETVCYYDLVNDTYAEADANITEPSAIDYLKECTENDAMTESDREYLEEYPEDIVYFYEYLSEDYLFDTGLLCYFRYDDYSDYDSYGYYFYDEAADQWYVLDQEAYYAGFDAYYAVSDRIYLRQELQDETTDITYDDLNAWTPNGGQSVVVSGISPYSVRLVGESGIVTYQKYGELGKVDWPEDTYGTWFVDDYIYECLYGDGEQYFYNYNGTENEWNSEWGSLSNGISFDSSSDGKYVMGFTYTLDSEYDDVPEDSMSIYEVTDGTLSLLESGISVSAWGIWQDDSYYYFEKDSEDTGNLCCFADGKTTTVLKNISNMQVRHYESGSYTSYADYTYDDGGTLKLFSADGESTKIASGVRSYCYIEDGLIVYLSDEKLYVYRGEDEDKSKIDGSVTSFTCNGAGYDILNY
jgi:hypothetical protein